MEDTSNPIEDRSFSAGRSRSWSDVPDAQWNDWKWHLRHRVRDVKALQRVIDVRADELIAFDGGRDLFNVAITPYHASLKDHADAGCPVRLQAVPRSAELQNEEHDLDDRGGGKIPILPDYVVRREEGRILLRNFRGKGYIYSEPVERS